MSWWYGLPPKPTVAERRVKAKRALLKLSRGGKVPSPVLIEGRTIARSVWGGAWCRHLESYRDFENRLPRGRSYVRSGSVIDLQITPGRVRAKVAGTGLYDVAIDIDRLGATRWKSLRERCAGRIGSLIELLQGRLGEPVMQQITDPDDGLFPKPGEIHLECSCPDWATMCKHVAAVLYGVGARLDHAPELLFVLRAVQASELIEEATRFTAGDARRPSAGGRRRLAAGQVGAVFGIELAGPVAGAGPVLKGGAEPEPEPALKLKSKSTPKAGSKLEAKPKPKANAKLKPKPKANAKPKSKSKPKSKPAPARKHPHKASATKSRKR